MSGPSFGEVVVRAIVEARGPALWSCALDQVTGPAVIKLEVRGDQRWARDNADCGPGGMCESSAASLLPTAALGALIGKFGGTDSDCPSPGPAVGLPAATPADAPQVFAVGTRHVFTVRTSGPLFLAMNDEPARFATHSGRLEVTISLAPTY